MSSESRRIPAPRQEGKAEAARRPESRAARIFSLVLLGHRAAHAADPILDELIASFVAQMPRMTTDP